jgi:hypothetical protein
MSSTEFARQTFVWLYQVNQDHDISKIDVAVCLQLTVYFNEKEGGRARAAARTIGGAIGLSERTVLRSMHRVEEHGHLRVAWGAQGRGHPNQCWMVHKPASPLKGKKTGAITPVSSLEKTGTIAPVLDELKPALGAGKPALGIDKTGAVAPENHLESPGNHTPVCAGTPQQRGRKIPTQTGKEAKEEKETQESDKQEVEAAAEAEAAAFARFWGAYPKRTGKLGAEAAFRAQLKAGIGAEQIIAAAKRYAADAVRLARDERYTKDPKNWLRDGCWADQDADSPVIDEHGNIVTMPRPQRAASGPMAVGDRLIKRMQMSRHNGGGDE